MITYGTVACAVVLLAMLLAARKLGLASAINRNRTVRSLEQATVNKAERWYWLLFGLALLVGLGVRLWRFPGLPRALNQDEVMAGVESLSLVRNGTDQYGTAWPVYFEAWEYAQMNVLYSYLMIPFVAVMGLTRLSLRLPMLLVSLLALPVMWNFARRMLGQNFALVVLWMVAICPWQIVQSRWALEANLMSHMMLFSIYVLYLGLRKKPLLYLSMALFGLTMYAYGITLYTIPPLLLLLAVYLLKTRRIRWWEALLCLGIYLVVAMPFLLMIAINAFGWETMRLGPFTIQNFPESVRTEDIAVFAAEPYAQMVENIYDLLEVSFLQAEGSLYQAYPVTRTLYAFSVPALFAGVYLLWRKRRQLAQGESEPDETTPDNAAAFFVLAWLGAMMVCCIFTNGSSVNRANGIFYPLLLCLCYALYWMASRVRIFTLGIAAVYAIGFGTFCHGYFSETYIEEVAVISSSGLNEALTFAHTLDCDRYYVSNTRTGDFVAPLYVMFAHQLDSKQRAGEEECPDAFGNPMGYFRDRYIFAPFDEFIPDPESCSAYVVMTGEKEWFPPEDFLFWDFDMYAVVYPRYWYED